MADPASQVPTSPSRAAGWPHFKERHGCSMLRESGQERVSGTGAGGYSTEANAVVVAAEKGLVP
jgi:hypothetical protein